MTSRVHGKGYFCWGPISHGCCDWLDCLFVVCQTEKNDCLCIGDQIKYWGLLWLFPLLKGRSIFTKNCLG